MLVELLINGGKEHFHVGVGFLNGLDALGAADDVHHDDVPAAVLFQKINGRDGASAGGQHGIDHVNHPVGDVLRQLAVVFHGLVGLRVAVQADVTDFCGGDQFHHVVHHAEAGAKDGDDGQLLAGQHPALGSGDGGLHLYLPGGQVAGGLIAHQTGNFADQLAEFLNGGLLVAQNGQLMLDQGMIEDVYVCHDISPSIYRVE